MLDDALTQKRAAQSLAEGPPVLAACLAHLDAGGHWARSDGPVAAFTAAAAEVCLFGLSPEK